MSLIGTEVDGAGDDRRPDQSHRRKLAEGIGREGHVDPGQGAGADPGGGMARIGVIAADAAIGAGATIAGGSAVVIVVRFDPVVACAQVFMPRYGMSTLVGHRREHRRHHEEAGNRREEPP